MKINKELLKQDRGYLLGSLDALSEEHRDIAKNIKKNISRSFMSINPSQIDAKISGSEFYLTRKYDGEFNVLLFDGNDSFLVNPGGKIRTGLKCLDEATKILKSKNISSGIFACEICMKENNNERARVFNVLKAWANPNMQEELCLVPFNIVEINDVKQFFSNYKEEYAKLVDLFGESALVFPPRYKQVNSKSDIREVYNEWTVDQNGEGLIVRSETPFVFKLKPRHSVDVVVVGYSEGIDDAKGQIRSMLLALMPEEGKYQIVGKTGNGFSDEMRKEILTKLQPLKIASQYIETDSNHVAFHMIKPQVILEVNFNDILTENSTDDIKNPILSIVDDKYKLDKFVSGFSFIFPIFERFRDDKSVNAVDLRLSQITDFVYIDTSKNDESNLGTSSIVRREVYKKESKGKLMVRKFMYWKTNKETSNRFSSYTFAYTDYSSDRKEPLSREVCISNKEEQIISIFENYLAENIKKGWEKVE